ncbi:MAG: hypothetical protein GY804_14215 [Alphaproteobacteria bacterium]|nr:hypothetical protein [Alphaproteobacteria bacterium]
MVFVDINAIEDILINTINAPIKNNLLRKNGDGLEMLGQQAISEYRNKITELNQEIEDINNNISVGNIEKLREEKEYLEQTLLSSLGIDGKSRKTSSEQ